MTPFTMIPYKFMSTHNIPEVGYRGIDNSSKNSNALISHESPWVNSLEVLSIF